MPKVNDDVLLQVLQAVAHLAPLYPVRFAKEQNIDRALLDEALDELRRRGLVAFTEWVKDLGQGYALTEAGRAALAAPRLPTTPNSPLEATPVEDLNHYRRGEIVRNAIFRPTTAYVTRILLALNLLAFAFGAVYASWRGGDVAEYLTGEGRTTTVILAELGALNPAFVFPDRFEPGARPEYERILLSSFLHFGLLHLFMNMYFLYSLAQQIEPMWGWPRYLAIYFVSALVSGCVVLLISEFRHLTPREAGLTAGASGCLFGVFVSMIVWFALNYEYLPERLFKEWSRNTMINVFLLVAINFVPGVSWQGHFGGAVGGLLAALLLHANRFHRSPMVRWLALAAVPLIPLGFFVALLWQAGRL